MSIVAVSIRLDTRKLDQIAAGLNKNTDAVLGMLAFKVEGEAKKHPPVPVDTHALQNSIEAEHIKELLWWVHDGMEYGIYQELGTWKMRAQPFMVPSAEKVGHELNSGALWRRLFE